MKERSWRITKGDTYFCGTAGFGTTSRWDTDPRDAVTWHDAPRALSIAASLGGIAAGITIEEVR